MVLSLANTRTSDAWVARKPGNWDRLNTRALFDSSNPYGFPDLPRAGWAPTELVAYNSRRGIAGAGPGAAVHFFLDDYRFEVAWNRPDQMAAHVAPVGAALTPDFSLWPEMPAVMQMWQVYRNRWCGAWLNFKGIRVIPTVGWAGPDSFAYAFEGIAPGSVVAVSTVGVVRNLQARKNFLAGYTEMLARLKPATVLVQGEPIPGMEAADLRVYPTRWR